MKNEIEREKLVLILQDIGVVDHIPAIIRLIEAESLLTHNRAIAEAVEAGEGVMMNETKQKYIIETIKALTLPEA